MLSVWEVTNTVDKVEREAPRDCKHCIRPDIGDLCGEAKLTGLVPDRPDHPFAFFSISNFTDRIFIKFHDPFVRSDVYSWSPCGLAIGGF